MMAGKGGCVNPRVKGHREPLPRRQDGHWHINGWRARLLVSALGFVISEVRLSGSKVNVLIHPQGAEWSLAPCTSVKLRSLIYADQPETRLSS